MKALRTVAVALGITLGALIVIPLVLLAGLFVWLKLTEEDDEEALELEQEGRAQLFFPEDMQITSTERNVMKLRANYQAGKQQMYSEWPAWKKFLESN